MLDAVLHEVQELAVTVFVALLSLGSAYALAYIRKARDALNQRLEHELANKAINRVAHLAEVAVLAAESTMAKELRKAVAEGKASRDQLVALGRSVVEHVLSQLNTEARKALSETVGDLRAYVEDIVEATLERLKAEGVVERVHSYANPKLSSPSPGVNEPQPA